MPRVRRLALAAAIATLIAPTAVAAAGGNDPAPSPRIVGGSDSLGYGWMVSLQSDVGSDDFERHFCGGSLIAPTWVLTAAHCVDGESASSLSVVLGETHLLDDEGDRIGVAEIRMHPSYEDEPVRNDIALLRLSKAARGHAFVPLAQASDGWLSSPGQYLAVTGWGSLEDGEPGTPALQIAYVPAAEGEECDYDGYDDDQMICAGYEEGGVDSCQGDSGGPLFGWDGDQPVQTGIVSYGDGCAQPDRPGVYTRVSAYWSWIRSVIGGRRLDLMFAIDATGSMSDDIWAARASSRVLTAVYGLMFDLRAGIVTFRDHPEETGDPSDYPARLEHELTDDGDAFRNALMGFEVWGGGDTPETVYSGVMAAIDRPWRQNARRAIVLFGDAPPKDPEPVTGYTQDDVVRAARAGLVAPPLRSLRASDPAAPGAVSIFGLTIGYDEEARAAFTTLAESTGGSALDVADAGEVASELSSLLETLAAEPVAAAGGPYSASVGQPVTLTGSGQDDDGAIVGYEWDTTGDGTTDATGPVVSWTFTQAGRFPVRLTVTDDDGLKAIADTVVDVAAVDATPPAVTPGPVVEPPRPPRTPEPVALPLARATVSGLRLDRRSRAIALRVSCDRAPCQGSVRVDLLTGRHARTARVLRLGVKRVTLRRSSAATVRLALSARARRALRRHARRGRVVVRAQAALVDAAGRAVGTTAVRRLRVRR